MSSWSLTELPSISETLGALYVGATIAAVLYGVTNSQGVIYYRGYPNDWWVYRYSVGLVWALDTVQVTLCTYTIYFYLIHFFSDLNGALKYYLWFMKWQLALNVILAVYIQGLYALRLWQLGRHFHKTIAYFVSLAVVASLGDSIFILVLGTAISVYITGKNPQQLYFTEYHILFQFQIYINSLLAMLNSRSKHHLTNQATKDEVNSSPTILCITPLGSVSDISETNISIPLPGIASFSNNLDPSKEDFDCRV
ncbi:hypothetical protein EV421DRAFT_1740050 [Armillaria borealis]|uniref:Uncharacterized protein n=1 Tax=Armillaria borealis TaxID=47425 RepID=A0AA39MJ59_9AGAR|nr:hypothetical protein EV421DRAFT_1740050 [Armillaria borealis]